jgi:hypothetical protein
VGAGGASDSYKSGFLQCTLLSTSSHTAKDTDFTSDIQSQSSNNMAFNVQNAARLPGAILFMAMTLKSSAGGQKYNIIAYDPNL